SLFSSAGRAALAPAILPRDFKSECTECSPMCKAKGGLYGIVADRFNNNVASSSSLLPSRGGLTGDSSEMVGDCAKSSSNSQYSGKNFSPGSSLIFITPTGVLRRTACELEPAFPRG